MQLGPESKLYTASSATNLYYCGPRKIQYFDELLLKDN